MSALGAKKLLMNFEARVHIDLTLWELDVRD